eukprot:m.301100 g.301100  ORF g.301100 m.301100 type:complete len:216 (+) comp40805_c1_seq26:1925-2572(+)
MMACSGRYFAIAQLLLNSGCCVNAVDEIGRTAVHYCCKVCLLYGERYLQVNAVVEFLSTIDVLIVNGSNFNSVDKFGVSPFTNALDSHMDYGISGDGDYVGVVTMIIIKKIVSAGANIEFKSGKLRDGALHLLADSLRGMDVLHRYGNLHVLSEDDIAELAEAFLLHGANPASRNKKGKYPYELVQGQLRLLLRKAFVKKNASIKSSSAHSPSPV